MMLRRLIPFLLLPLLAASCDEVFDFGTDEEGNPVEVTMQMSHHTMTLMAGDSCRVWATFTPDDGGEHTVFFLSDDDDIARMQNDTVVATGEGEVKVRCTSVTGLLQDSCTVTVIPQWTVDAYQWQYDMMVYASVQVGDAVNSDRFLVAAFVGDEVRGVGQLLTAGDRKYWAIRVYSNLDTSDDGVADDEEEEDVEPTTPESVIFRCYERGRGTITDFATAITFDGMAHGTLSAPVVLKK